ncbi:MAG TPA: hypothetical protein VGD31_14355 [Sphingobacteriaceae bacterium]
MDSQEINYVYNGFRYRAGIQLLSPLTWIFLVDSQHFEPFHIEYDDTRKKWIAIEKHLNDNKLVSAIGAELTKLYRKDIERTVPSSKFSSLEFFVVDNGREDIICFWDSELRIRVAPLTDSPVYEDSKELLYYGDDFGTPVAFQTIDYHGEDPELILNAIKWYAQYLDYPQMVVSKENPLSNLNG